MLNTTIVLHLSAGVILKKFKTTFLFKGTISRNNVRGNTCKEKILEKKRRGNKKKSKIYKNKLSKF